MKQFKLLFATISLVCFEWALYVRIDSPGDSVLGVFVGTSPCADVAKSLLKIPSNVSCDRIKWNLTLNQHPTKFTPTIYKLTREYGYHIDNRTFAPKGVITIEGKWTRIKGTKTNADAVVYQLHSASGGRSISFLKVSNDLLHLSDNDRSLMIGDGGQSYTLSRAKK